MDDGFLTENNAAKFDILQSKGWQDDPVLIRPFHAGDEMSYEQTFMGFDFDWMKKIDAKLIVDCGAYVGYTTYMFRKWFPNAYVVAVEPNEENFRQLKRHTAIWYNTQKLEIVNKAIWYENDKNMLSVLTDKGTDSTCYLQGAEIKPGIYGSLYPVNTITIDKILSWFKRRAIERIDILKIDIEGSEAEVFAKNNFWLNYVNNICIEIHAQNYDQVLSAMTGYNFKHQRNGEHEIFLNIRKK